MAHITINAEHGLGTEEALRRLKERLGRIPEYRRQITDSREEWDGDTLSFRFRAVGMRVSGTLQVADANVRVAAKVPFAAMLFKKRIDKSVRAELNAALAPATPG